MKKAKIWTSENCKICDSIRQYLVNKKYKVIEKDVTRLEDIQDIDIMTQLCEQNMQLPIIEINSEFVKPQEFLTKMKGVN